MAPHRLGTDAGLWTVALGAWEEANGAEPNREADALRVWLSCDFGHDYVHGACKLAVKVPIGRYAMSPAGQ
jgi:hypothetical protein